MRTQPPRVGALDVDWTSFLSNTEESGKHILEDFKNNANDFKEFRYNMRSNVAGCAQIRLGGGSKPVRIRTRGRR